MPLREIVQLRLVSCRPDDTIKDAADLMKRHDVGAVLILKSKEDRKPIGIVTDRDIVLKTICEGIPADTAVEKIMTKSVATVSVDEGIQDVIRCMKENEIRRVPVVDEAGRAVGLVSFGDVFSLLAKEMAELTPATHLRVAA